MDVHSTFHGELAAQRQGELIADAGRHELARLARAEQRRPSVVERLRALRRTPQPAPYRRDWLLARTLTQA